MKLQQIRISDIRRCAEYLREDDSGEKAVAFLEKTVGMYTEKQRDTIFKVAEDLIYRTQDGALVRKYVLGDVKYGCD